MDTRVMERAAEVILYMNEHPHATLDYHQGRDLQAYINELERELNGDYEDVFKAIKPRIAAAAGELAVLALELQATMDNDEQILTRGGMLDRMVNLHVQIIASLGFIAGMEEGLKDA